MTTYYIGADVHCNTTEIAVEVRGRIVDRVTVPTTIPAIRQVLDRYPGIKHLAIEESTLAGWFYRNLRSRVDSLIVCDPRRNHLIAADGDKDDQIDAAKLAALLRGGFLRPVHHSEDPRRIELKHWVNLYHQRVKEHTRSVNRLRACARAHGVAIPGEAIRRLEQRTRWLNALKDAALPAKLQMLWIGLDAVDAQVRLARQHLSRFVRQEPILNRWKQIPGLGPIRALTLLAYLDTPWRFASKSKLWKYCGAGLERQSSGTDKKGTPRPARLALPRRRNGILKNAVFGAVQTALNSKSNLFTQPYERMVSHGITPSNARHTLARKLLTVLWGMWKSNTPFDPARF